MQFSVIVEGSIDQSNTTEDSLAELERFLLAAKISPQIVHQLKSGQSQLIKNELTYEEAVKICDRLMDFGLESIIDPPIKPDVKPAPDKSQVHQIPVQQKQRGRVAAPGKSNCRQAPVKTTDNVRPIRQPAAAPNVAAKPLANQDDLQRAAERIKSLFKIPKGGLNPITMDSGSVLNLRIQAFVCWLLLCIQPMMMIAAGIATLLITYYLFLSLASLSIVLACLIAILPIVIGSYLTLVLSTSFWKNKKHQPVQQAITAKEQTQLFMLTNAICKLLSIPSPKTICFDIPPTKYSYNTLRLQPQHTPKEFWKINQPLNADIALSISANLVNSLSVRRYCGLVARECGRYSAPQARRSTVMQLAALHWFEKAVLRSQTISERLSSQPIAFVKLQNIVEPLLNFTHRIESINQGYLSFCEKIVRNQLDRPSSPFSSYQTAIIGDEAITSTFSQMADIDQAYFDCLTTLFDEEDTPALVDNIPSLTDQLLPKPANEKNPELAKMPLESVIVGSALLKDVVVSFDKACQSLTTNLYKQMGYEVEAQNFVSVKSYFANKEKQKKLESLGSEYFGKWFHPNLLWRVPAANTLSSTNTESLIKKLNRCIERIRYQTPDRSATIEKLSRMLPMICELSASRKLAMSGVEFKAQGASASGKSIDELLKKAQGDFKDLNTELGQHNALIGERMALGLMLDIEHRENCQKIYTALATLTECSTKNLQLQFDCHELDILLSNKPRKMTQHYTLQSKELSDRIEESCKQIVRRLKHCPFDMCDTRYKMLADMIDSKSESSFDSGNAARALLRGKKILAVVSSGHTALSQLAAGYATRVEKIYGIESIRKAK